MECVSRILTPIAHEAAMPTGEATTLLAELTRFQLLSPDRLAQIKGNIDGTDDKRLAAELIARGWLTPFQINQLMNGRGESLVLGPYILLERLGRGGMGEVFKARHTLMNRVVALKVLRSDLLHRADSLDRFRREIEAAAKLTHPNVVIAHDAAQVGNVCFLVMEYVAGTDLARLLKQRGSLPPAEAASLVRQALLGLQHAHERGLVHRDLKPSNLMLTTDGQVKLLDLGLARLRGDLAEETAPAPLTHEGMVMGTPDYLAPEQALDAHTADIRSDIYSLGCTLYHLLTGRPPFPGGTMTEKLLRHQQTDPDRIETVNPAAPAALGNVVRTMMARRPQDRYQTPNEAAAALAPFAGAVVNQNVPEGLPVDVPRGDTLVVSPEPTLTMRPAARRSLGPAPLFLLLGCGLLALLGLVVTVPLVVFVFAVRSQPDGGPDLEPVQVGGDLLPDPGPAPPAKKPGGDPKPVVAPPLGKLGEPAKLPPLPEDAPQLVKHLRGHTGPVQALAFSPDGTLLASGSTDEQLRLWNGRTGEARGKPISHGAPVRTVAFSRDGQRMATGSYAVAGQAMLRIWNPADLRAPQSLGGAGARKSPSGADMHAMAFSLDGKRLTTGGGPLRLWNLNIDGDVTDFPWHKTFPSYLYAAAFSPDGKLVAAGCHEIGDCVRVWEIDKMGEPIVLQGNAKAFGISHSDVRGALAFTTGGKILVRVTSNSIGGGFGVGTGSVKVWDVNLPKREFLLRDTYKIPGGAVYALATAADGGLRVASTRGPAPFAGGPRPAPKPADVAVHLWDGPDSKTRTFDTGHKGPITVMAFSPDGAFLATASEDESIKLWRLTR